MIVSLATTAHSMHSEVRESVLGKLYVTRSEGYVIEWIRLVIVNLVGFGDLGHVSVEPEDFIVCEEVLEQGREVLNCQVLVEGVHAEALGAVDFRQDRVLV